jgi:hypothetical protein
MMPVKLRPRTVAPSRSRRHPLLKGVGQFLHTAFPLPDDEPEERLSKALAALVAALEWGREAERLRGVDVA